MQQYYEEFSLELKYSVGYLKFLENSNVSLFPEGWTLTKNPRRPVGFKKKTLDTYLGIAMGTAMGLWA